MTEGKRMGRRLHDHERCCLELPRVDRPRHGLPVELDGRDYRGDLDIRVDADGVWHYNQSPLTRKTMVCLFASMLAKDRQGGYWLVTPTELGRIAVDDAPLLGVEAFVRGSGRAQRITIVTNVDEGVDVSRESPLVIKASPVTGAMTPYVQMESGIEVRLIRSVYRALVSRGGDEDIAGDTVFGVWSDGVFFPLDFPPDFPLDFSLGATFAGDA